MNLFISNQQVDLGLYKDHQSKALLLKAAFDLGMWAMAVGSLENYFFLFRLCLSFFYVGRWVPFILVFKTGGGYLKNGGYVDILI